MFYFFEYDKVNYCGKHLLFDLVLEKGNPKLCDFQQTAEALKQAAVSAGASVLSEQWHHFGDNCGYTGVVLLAESHMSIHTWPEHGIATIDVFMCGNCDPKDTLTPICNFFGVEYPYNFTIEKRGFYTNWKKKE